MHQRNYEGLSLSLENGVAQLRLRRPELLNRFDETLHREFADAILELSAPSDVRVLVICAEGKAFSAGGDMEMMLRANESKNLRDRLSYEGKIIVDVFASLPFPVIAAVQGAAIGLGATILALSDIVVACQDAVIADPHVQLGLVAGDGGVVAWAQSAGLNRAKRYLLTGDRLTAREAYGFGLVTDLVERPDDVMPTAMAIASRIAALPRGGVEGTKRAFAKLTQQISGPVFELSFAYEMETLASPELRETVRKVLDR